MLKLLQNSEYVSLVSPGARFKLPDGRIVMRAEVDWTLDEFSLVEQEARPSSDHQWQDGAWVYVEPPETGPADLSPARFAWLLAFTGLGDIWSAMEDATKDTDRATYAALVARRASRFFTLNDTLAAVAQFAPLAAQVAPEVDLSEAAIRAAWAQAETAQI